MNGLNAFAAKIEQGDARAFERVYNQLHRLVFSVCLSIVKRKELAEELTQETFVAVWQKSGEFNGQNYKAWVLTIAKNKALNALKKARREQAVDFTENEYLLGSYTLDDRDLGAVLSSALRKLPEDEAQIVLLKNSGMKTKEIAEYLGEPRGTVSWRYSKAIKTLQNYLKEAEL